MGSGTLNESVLVGREHELEELQSYLDFAIKGRGNTVFVSGEAGAGKTRLVSEFLKTAKKSDVTVLTGWCLSNAAVPYFPFFEAFNAYFTREPIEEAEGAIDVTGWLKGPSQAKKAGKPQAFSPQVWKDHTFAAVAKTLTAISAKKPIVLFIDDVHWADSASLALIHYLARIVKSEKALVVATFRSEQLTIDAEGRPCPLVETLRLMRREDLYEEVKLATLDKKDVSTLASNMLGGGEVLPEFVEKLTNESQGNPLFVVESLRMLHERDGLVLQQGNWRLALDELEVPDKIKDIILQRLSGLTLNQRKTLEAAAVIGERFDAQLLASMLSLELSGVVETLDAIGRTTSLVCCEGELYKFDHARSRDAVYGEISSVLRKVYHAKAAETLEGKRREGDLLSSDLFYHYSQAGNKEKAVKYALAAGQDALARWSNAQAIEHFSYALQNLPDGQSEQRRTALEGLGDAYAANSMYREAIKTFDELAALETGRQRLCAIRKAMDAAYFIWGASDLLLQYSKKAEELCVDDRLEMARILVNRGRAFGFAADGNSKMDLADSDAALQVFEEECSLADVATALWRSGVICGILEGLEEKGLGELLRSVSIFKELGDIRKEAEATYWTGSGFHHCLLHSEARHEFANVLRNAEKLGMFAELSLACVGLGVLDEYDGKFAEAISDNLRASEYGKKTDAVSGLYPSIGHLIRIYSKLGDLKQVDKYSEKVSTYVHNAGLHYLIAPDTAMTKGIRFAAKGQWNESNETFKKLLESLKTIGFSRLLWKFRSGIDYAWALEKQGRLEEAKAQLAEAQRIQRETEARFEHANLQANLMARRQVVVGEEFEMRVDCVNVGRKPALLVEIRKALLDYFKITSSPPWCVIQGDAIKMENKEIGAFQVNTAKFTFKILKSGTFTLNPQVVYIDDMGKEKICTPRPVTITSNPPTAPERVAGKIPSGTPDLDRLLMGGVPENYAIVLAASSNDERALLVERFLEAGAAAGEITFYITAETRNIQALAEKQLSNLYLFLCNPRTDAITHDLPNVIRLKGIENLTEIDIALTKAFRTLNPADDKPKRACLEIVSDVLLHHHAVVTRKWLNGLLPELRTKGFTTLAVVNPQMHPQEEVQAILGLFEGEISVSEKETAKGTEKVLKIRRLYNQKYLENELVITRDKLDQA